jgi:hypothetical protein
MVGVVSEDGDAADVGEGAGGVGEVLGICFWREGR